MFEIKCGHCHLTHRSVEMVRACSILTAKPKPAVLVEKDQFGRMSDYAHTPDWGQGAKKAASENLQTLLAVPAGRYALTDGINPDDGLQSVKFYKVSHGKGTWAGRTFVVQLVADGGFGLAEYKIWDAELRSNVLASIAADPQEASLLYGQELGECGVCGRPLTDDESRDKGIGPVCASKRGW